MSSLYSATTGGSRSTGKNFFVDSAVYKFWDENIKGILFGVLYTMVKENKTMNKIFLIASFVIEFFEMIILCFRNAFKWGDLEYSFDFNHSMMSFQVYTIVFWIIAATLIISFLNLLYLGYTFYKGEIRQSFLLKTARWFVSFYSIILFIPVVYILLTVLGCSYATKKLLLYPSEECWGGHSVMSVVSIIVLVCFLLCCFLSCFTYYEHDPNTVRSSARLHNRFEAVVLVGKLAVVLVAVLGVKKPEAFIVVSVLVMFTLFIGSVLTLPYYDHKLNLIRAGSFGGVLYVHIGMVVSYALNQPNSAGTIIAFTAGIPLACVVGAFVADRRFKYLCDPSLVESSSEEMHSLPVQPGKKKKSVNFEQPKAKILLQNKLYSRLRFPWDVEIAARFIISGTPNSSHIEKAKIVYQTGLSKFPKSPTVLQGYANFMFTVVGDWQLGYVILEKLRKTSIMIDVQFFIYSYDKDRVRRTEGGHDRIGDFVDFMEFKKLQQLARRNHMTCLVCVRKFWRYLLEPKVDVMQLSLLSSKIAQAEKKAIELYSKLISNYPKNVSVLRDYAKFLDEVILDERAAHEINKKAEKYEHEEMESVTASHRSSNPTLEPPSEENSDHESEMRSEHSLESWEEKTVSSKSSGVNTKMNEAKLDKYNSLKRLGRIMIGTTAFVILVAIVEVIVLNSMLSNYDNAFENQNTAGGAAHNAMRASRSLADCYLVGRRLWQFNISFPSLGSFDYVNRDATIALNAFSNNVKSLYWGDSRGGSFASIRFLTLKQMYGYSAKVDISDHDMAYEEFDHDIYDKRSILDFFNEPRYNQSNYVADVNVTSYSNIREFQITGLWSLCSLFTSTTFDVLSLSLPDYMTTAQVSTKFNSLAFAIENSQAMARGMLDLVDYYANTISSSLNRIILVCLIIFCAATALLIFAVITVFRPTVSRIFESKVRTYTMFTLIPSSVVRTMTKRRIVNMNKGHSSDEEEEVITDDETRKRAGSITRWKSTTNMVQSESLLEVHHDKPPTAVAPYNSETVEMLLPHSTDTPDNKESVISFRASNIDHSNIDEQIPPRPASAVTSPLLLHETKGYASDDGLNISKKFEEKDSLIVTIDQEEEGKREKEIQHHQPSKIKAVGKILVNGISAITDKIRGSTYRKIEDEDDKKDKHVDDSHSTKHSKLDISSLNAVTRNMHFSYLLAIAVVIGGLLAAFLGLRVFLTSMVDISTDFKNADLRTQYVQTVGMDISILTLYSYNSTTATNFRHHAQVDIDTMWKVAKRVNPKTYQMDILYSSDCFNINRTNCLNSSSPYYPLIRKGYDFAFYSFYTIAKGLVSTYTASNTQLNASSPEYLKFRTLTEILIDGSELLTFEVYKDAKEQIANTKQYIGVVTGVECVIFFLIYIILFRPFVQKLRAENEHTFSLIRMIPRKLLKDVPEIAEFIQETVEGTVDDD